MREGREKKEEIEWDKKRIIITAVIVVVLLGVAFQLKSLFLDDNSSTIDTNVPKKQIQGVNIQEASQGLRQNITDNIENLREEAQSLDIAEVASSSPQVQKIINDLKSLKDLPKNQLKDACEKVCGGL